MRSIAILGFLSLALGSFALIVPEQIPLGSHGGPIHTADSWSYKLCGQPSDPLQVQSIEVTPDPPQPGQDLTVKVRGIVTETLEEGAYADVVVKLGRVTLLKRTFDLCEEARNANTTVQCPVEPGEYTVEHTVELPKEIPRAKFQVAVNGYTVDEEDLVCLQLTVDFMKRPFPPFKW